jgi:hypothetical protein
MGTRGGSGAMLVRAPSVISGTTDEVRTTIAAQPNLVIGKF